MKGKALKAFDEQAWSHTLGELYVRWFPGRWSLQQRKMREVFSAVIEGLPDQIRDRSLLSINGKSTASDVFNKVKSYKIIKNAQGKNVLIGFFANHQDLVDTLTKPFIYKDNTYEWSQSSFKQQKKKKTLPDTVKNSTSVSSKKKKAKSTSSPKQDKAKKSKSKSKKSGKKDVVNNDGIAAEILKLLLKN
jgi:hypothetical protein